MFKKSLVLIFIVLITTACSFKSSRTAILIDGSKTDYTKQDSWKSGEACMSKLLGLPLSTDRSIATAVMNGGISKIKHVDEESRKGFLTEKHCTIVYGN